MPLSAMYCVAQSNTAVPLFVPSALVNPTAPNASDPGQFL